MKKILLSATFLVGLNFTSIAQDTLLFENFQNPDTTMPGAPETFSYNPPTGTDNFWINFDGDGMPDASLSGTRPLEWFSGIGYDIDDPNNIVAISSSWTDNPAVPIQNWIMTPPITITDTSYTLYWKSCPRQIPYYLDGYKVLVSKTSNLEANFTDTLAVFAEYVSRLNPLVDSSFASYTFSPGFVHGADGQYITYNNDSARFLGSLRPDSISLANYVGQTIYIGFVADSHDDNLLYLDDIMVYSPTVDAIKENYANNFNMQVFPNPASQTARVNFSVEQYSRVFISILDMEGKLVKKFDKGQLMTGNHFADLDLTNIPQGNYFVQINSNYKTQASKLTITK